MLLGRTLISALILFELLNLAGILNFTLDFSWAGLLVTSLGILLVLEISYTLFPLPALPYLLASISHGLDVLGDVARLYGKLLWYDQLMHVIGGAVVMATALAIFSTLRQKIYLPLFLILFLSLSLVALFGSLYEIEEYLEDRFYHERQVRLGDGPDTADDLLWNLAGGVLVGALYALSRKKRISY
ncbi:MAG: hypothetical protein Q8R12_01345 [bacterium]|nr:hypothetical protein [bacterium]